MEKYWSKLKGLLRSAQAGTGDTLEDAINEALSLLSPNDVEAWFRTCFGELQ